MGQIKVEKNAGGIEGLCVIEPAVHGDARGYFMETYNQRDMEEAGLNGVRTGQPVMFGERCVAWSSFSERISTGQACTSSKGVCV